MLTNNVSGVEYAVQAAFDSKHKLLVHSHIGASTDKRELSTAALTVQELLQLDSFNTLSDAGYLYIQDVCLSSFVYNCF